MQALVKKKDSNRSTVYSPMLNSYLYQNINAVKRCGAFRIKARWKSCEIKHGGQEMVVIVG